MKQRLLHYLSYAMAGTLSLAFAFWLAGQFFAKSKAQDSVDDVPPPPPEILTDAPAETAPNVPGLDEGIDSFLSPYNYDAENRRDPFREYKAEVVGGQTFEEEGSLVVGPLRPLQRFELDEIQLVGIIWDVEEPKAMFLDPTKKIHILNKDERIGRKNGYIASIREGEVVIVEAVKVRGQLAFTTKVMKIVK